MALPGDLRDYTDPRLTPPDPPECTSCGEMIPQYDLDDEGHCALCAERSNMRIEIIEHLVRNKMPYKNADIDTLVTRLQDIVDRNIEI